MRTIYETDFEMCIIRKWNDLLIDISIAEMRVC